MAWTTPLTATANTALTASQWNASVRDNLNETAVAKATVQGSHFVGTAANAIAERIPAAAFVTTSETTASTSYVDLATVGPAITATTGAMAMVGLYTRQSNGTAGANVWTSMAVSGATTLAASDNFALSYDSPVTGSTVYHGTVHMQTGLTPGSNTFTHKYRASSGTGTFNQRRLWVLPF